jgi:hypothetical protein
VTSNGPKHSHGQDWVVPGAMSRHRSSPRGRAAVGELPPDLYVVPGPWPRLGRPAAETGRRLKRLYDAIENGVADLDDPALKDRIAGLKSIRDQAQADADRAQAMAESAGQQAITPAMVQKLARTARECIRTDGGGYRRGHLRALAQRVEVADGEVRIMGSKGNLIRTLAAASGVTPATPSVRSSVLNWRREWDSNPRYAFTHTRFPSVRLKPLGHLSGTGPLLTRPCACRKAGDVSIARRRGRARQGSSCSFASSSSSSCSEPGTGAPRGGAFVSARRAIATRASLMASIALAISACASVPSVV